MAGKTISSLNVVLGANVAPFVSAFRGAGQAAENLIGKLGETASAVLKVTGAAAIIGTAMEGVRGVFGSLNDSISLASQLEQNQVAFETMTGSAQKAADMMSNLTSFAAATPFQFPELAGSAKQLLAFGVNVDQIIPSLKTLGDIASGVGAPLDEVAHAYGEVVAGGRLSGKELLMFTMKGIPLLGTLANQMGKTTAEIRKMIEEGEVGLPDLQKALAGLTGPGGQFANMMQKQSTTLGGLWSTLTDNVSISLAKMVTAIVNSFHIKGGLQALIASTGTIGDYLTAKVQTFAPIVMEQAGKIVPPLINAFTAAYNAVAPIVTGIAGFVQDHFGQVASFVQRHASTIAGAFTGIGAVLLGPSALGVLASVGKMLSPLAGVVTAAVGAMLGPVGLLTAALGGIGAAIGMDRIASAFSAIRPYAAAAGQAVMKAFGVLGDAATQAGIYVYNLIAPIISVWTQGENLKATGIVLAGIGGAVATGFVAWRAATVALVGAQIGLNAVMTVYGAISTGVTAAAAGVAIVQWSLLTAYTAVKGAVVGVATSTVITTAAHWAAATATAAVSAAYDVFCGALLAARLGGIAYTAGVIASTIASNASAAAMWLQTAALTAGRAIYAAITGEMTVAGVASAAWAAITGTLTVAQWLLNVALTANPIGIVVMGATALVAAFVAAGGATAVLVAGMAELSTGATWVKKAFAFAEFAAKNWQLTLKVVGAEVAYFAVRTASQIRYLFTEVLPPAFDWFRDNWKNLLTDAYNFTGVVFDNLTKNISGFFTWLAKVALDQLTAIGKGVAGLAVKIGGLAVELSPLAAIARETGESFQWQGLTDGFHSSLTQLPKIADRQIGPLEKQLGDEAARLADKFKNGMAGIKPAADEGDKGWFGWGKDPAKIPAEEAANAANEAMRQARAQAEDLMKAAGQTVTPKIEPFKIDTGPLDDLKNKAKDATSAVSGLEAVLSRSAESMKLSYSQPFVDKPFSPIAPPTPVAPQAQAVLASQVPPAITTTADGLFKSTKPIAPPPPPKYTTVGGPDGLFKAIDAPKPVAPPTPTYASDGPTGLFKKVLPPAPVTVNPTISVAGVSPSLPIPPVRPAATVAPLTVTPPPFPVAAAPGGQPSPWGEPLPMDSVATLAALQAESRSLAPTATAPPDTQAAPVPRQIVEKANVADDTGKGSDGIWSVIRELLAAANVQRQQLIVAANRKPVAPEMAGF